MELMSASLSRGKATKIRRKEDTAEMQAIIKNIETSVSKGSFSCYISKCGSISKEILEAAGYTVKITDDGINISDILLTWN